jgi:threonine dehydratase
VDTVIVPVDDVAAAMRLLFERNKIIAEGAGAIALAAALPVINRWEKRFVSSAAAI